MEGLHNRKKDKVNEEDETEFLDEEEQEKLLQDLHDQNNKANLSIQRGLIIIGCITLALFFNILIQRGTPIIPISQVFSSIPVKTVLRFPTLAAFTSILSIGTSILALIMKCKMNIFGLLYFNQKDRYISSIVVYTSIIAGLMAPLMSLLHGSSWIELVYWFVPSLVTSMYYTAFYMMNQVQTSLEELEKSKYKYKGA